MAVKITIESPTAAPTETIIGNSVTIAEALEAEGINFSTSDVTLNGAALTAGEAEERYFESGDVIAHTPKKTLNGKI